MWSKISAKLSVEDGVDFKRHVLTFDSTGNHLTEVYYNTEKLMQSYWKWKKLAWAYVDKSVHRENEEVVDTFDNSSPHALSLIDSAYIPA